MKKVWILRFRPDGEEGERFCVFTTRKRAIREARALEDSLKMHRITPARYWYQDNLLDPNQYVIEGLDEFYYGA